MTWDDLLRSGVTRIPMFRVVLSVTHPKLAGMGQFTAVHKEMEEAKELAFCQAWMLIENTGDGIDRGGVDNDNGGGAGDRSGSSIETEEDNVNDDDLYNTDKEEEKVVMEFEGDDEGN